MTAGEVELSRTSPDEPGWSRRRRGRGFSYLDARGRPIGQESVLRVRQLAIPPAWTDVWICADPDGHLQAVGTDEAGRRQYLYHPQWREEQDEVKFARAEELGRRLGRARTTVARHLRGSARELRTTCAIGFRLLDLGCFRAGAESYAAAHGSVGLTTLTCGHVRRRLDQMTFTFVGKAAVDQVVMIDDVEVVEALDRLRRGRRSDDALLLWSAPGGPRGLDSSELNDYIRDVTGVQVSAKDFRTWHATCVAAAALARQDSLGGAMEAAAALLGNTPTQARTSYVDPRVVEAWRQGRTVPVARAEAARSDAKAQRRLELQVLRLLAETD